MKFDTTHVHEMEKGTDEHMAIVERFGKGGVSERFDNMIGNLEENIDTPHEFTDFHARGDTPAEVLGKTRAYYERIEDETDLTIECELSGEHYVFETFETWGVDVVITQD